MSRVSGRPRKASDDEVFAAAVRVMSRVGPASLTLAEIASEAGLTAGALVQRFGGKKQLLRAMSAQLAEGTGDALADLREKTGSPLEALRAYARCFAGLAETPEALARSLAYLNLDLTDPELYQNLLKQARATRRAIEKLLEEAVTTRELPRNVDPASLARAVEVTLNGSLMTWAIHREGTAADWLLADLDRVLGLPPARKRSARRPSGHSDRSDSTGSTRAARRAGR